jgi:uncharacterized protein YecT (DUF1311 family)
MLADAQGGPRDSKRASDLFDGCFADVTVQSVRDEAAKRSQGSSKPLDFCKDIGGTTLSMQACAGMELDRAIAERQAAAWPVVSKLDTGGRAAWVAAAQAWSKFARAAGEVVGDAYRGGSMEGLVIVESTAEQERERTKRIAGLASYRPDPAASPAAAEGEMARALKQRLARASDADERKLVQASQTAWLEYRDAETAFYRALLAGKADAAAVDRDVRASLAAARAAGLKKRAEPGR